MYFDWLGKEIKAGSKIVYPGRRSSSLWMNLAEVLEIIPVDNVPRWLKDKGAELSEYDLAFLDKLKKTAFKLRVKTQRVSWFNPVGNIASREATIEAVGRVTVVD